MRLLPQRRLPNRPRAAGSSQGGQRFQDATGDEQAVNGNAFSCQAKFAAHGPRIPAVNLGTPDNQGSRHFGSNAAGTAAIARWFRQLERQPRPAATRA